ncbi:WD40 repeat domain-containing protein [Dapis sp. BLCC M126]
MWDANTGEQIGKPLQHQDWVWSVAFNHDSTKIVSGGNDKTVRVWDVNTGEQIGEALQHQGPVRSVAFNHDGTKIVSGSEDNMVRVWDISLERLVGRVCEKLRYHPILAEKTDVAREAKQTCKRYFN